MPTVSLPEQPSMERLRKLARRLLNGVRAGDPQALAVLAEFAPGDAADVTLSRAQLALARRYRFPSWPRLRRHVEIINARSWVMPGTESAGAADRFLELACLNYTDDNPARRARALALWTNAEKRRTRGVDFRPTQTGWGRSVAGGDREVDLWTAAEKRRTPAVDSPPTQKGRAADDRAANDRAANGLAANGLAAAGLAVAAACADVEAVRADLRTDPAAATRPAGPYGWSPLMYLVYARHDPHIGRDATLATARLLLDAGADPNDGRFFLGLPTPFTVLTGVFAGDSPDEPAHPHAAALATLLLDAGADPNDGQTLYNRMFGTADDHLELLFAYGLGQDRNGPWYRLLGDQLESPAEMLSALLDYAVSHDQRDRVALLAAHGVDVTGPIIARRGYHHTGRTPIEVALINGNTALADRLRALGATESGLDPADAFRAAVMSGEAAPDMTAAAEARRRYPGLMVWAAGRRRTRPVELLARAGFDVNALGRSDTPAKGRWETALHAAAGNGDGEMVALLLRLGADRDIEDTRFGSTPRGWAEHFGHTEVADLLA